MRIITRTIYGSRLQTAKLLGLPYTAVANTTLNEKFGVQSGVMPDGGAMPNVRYFCLGNGGHRNDVGADGFPFTSPVQHRASDASLYKPMPFLIRPVAEDLTLIERTPYAMRKALTIAGENYIAYYLKRLDLTDVALEMLHNTVADGVTTTEPFVPDSSNLNPLAPTIPSTGLVSTNGDYLSCSAVLRLDFSAQDVAELVNVAQIMYDNENYAVVSEIGMVAGVDKIVSATGPGGTFNYNEVVQAIITTHITAHYSVGFSNQGFDFGLELGAVEPLIGVTTE